jgi:hypothetical protein
MKKRGKAGKAKSSKRKASKRECKDFCGCNSEKKWEECCGRCTIPC